MHSEVRLTVAGDWVNFFGFHLTEYSMRGCTVIVQLLFSSQKFYI